MYVLRKESFGWDDAKNETNQRKHGVSFEEAQSAFSDPDRIIAIDLSHSTGNKRRFYCLGRTEMGVLTVRFTYRKEVMRIIGAGFWRKGRKA